MEDTKTLDEVVVIGYGTQKKADLTGSVANVSTDDLNTQSNTTIGQALQGKIAGVDIVSQGGAPGGSTRVMVRGVGREQFFSFVYRGRYVYEWNRSYQSERYCQYRCVERCFFGCDLRFTCS